MTIEEVMALKSLPGIGDGTIKKLIELLSGYGENLDASETLNLLLQPSVKLGKPKKAITELYSPDNFSRHIAASRSKLSSFRALGVDVLAISCLGYPNEFRKLKDPPALLYCKGDTSLLNKGIKIAIVGTRNPTLVGSTIAKKTAAALAGKDAIIVSGLALGIDSQAHQGCINVDGKTISILVDVDNVSPAQNRSLADDILKTGGLLIAENPPGERVFPQLFAKRDRLQSALSKALIVVETSINGGTMHAARAAKDMNIPIYVPDAKKISLYDDLTIDQLQGIEELVTNFAATPYTKADYDHLIGR